MRVTSDILSVGALWGSSGDVYNGLFFFFFGLWFFGLCISWRNVIENWALFFSFEIRTC